MIDLFSIHSYDYDLPEELIAQTPAERRDMSRLMVLKKDGYTEHKHFCDIIDYLNPGDALVVNQSKVIPARLYGEKEGTGAKCEVLLLRQLDDGTWETLVRPGNKIRPGHRIIFDGALYGDVLERTDAGGRILRLVSTDGSSILAALDRVGTMPLPPYIKKRDNDPSRYQTVYANQPGSAAAPTAGLHFTQELLDKISQKGVHIEKLLLHVGLGTFRPVDEEDIRQHKMHSEYYSFTEENAEALNNIRVQGGRIIAVGTTSVRVLETVCSDAGIFVPSSGETNIFIYPGYRYKAVDSIITNFHLPESTLLMLVSAFAGRERVLSAYETAVKEKYRFFSFGDAMFIEGKQNGI